MVIPANYAIPISIVTEAGGQVLAETGEQAAPMEKQRAPPTKREPGKGRKPRRKMKVAEETQAGAIERCAKIF